jgi:hypothetical protein
MRQMRRASPRRRVKLSAELVPRRSPDRRTRPAALSDWAFTGAKGGAWGRGKRDSIGHSSNGFRLPSRSNTTVLSASAIFQTSVSQRSRLNSARSRTARIEAVMSAATSGWASKRGSRAPCRLFRGSAGPAARRNCAGRPGAAGRRRRPLRRCRRGPRARRDHAGPRRDRRPATAGVCAPARR